jgi:hypothetical protein
MAQSNIILYGDVIGNSSSNTVYSITGISATSTIPVNPATLQWLSTVASPTLSQFTNAYVAGQNLTIQAQGSTFNSANGGNLVLASGTTSSGTVGNIQLQLGNTTGLTLLATGTLQFGTAITAGGISQASSSGTATNLNITAQSAGGSANNGGALILTSGASTTTGTSGNVTFNAATPGTSGTTGNILFQISGTTQAFVTGLSSSTGLGIGSTPGTSPTVTSGSGTPSTTQTSGSIYLNTSTTNTGLYTRQNSAWSQLISSSVSTLTAPVTEAISTNTSHSIYTVDSTTGSYDGVILHNRSGFTTYVMPAPTAGRQIIIRDITGSIETTATNGTNANTGFITGTGTNSNTIFIAPHGTESFNTSSGFVLSGVGTFNVTNGSATVTATGSSFTTQLAPGMSITFNAQLGISYTILSIASNTSLTLATNYTGTTTTISSATMNSLAYYANYGTLTLISDGTNWFASSNKPLRAYLTGSTGSFFVSPGITNAFITAAGGGGGGGGGTSTGSGGGGGGGAIQSTTNISVTPNTTYGVTIGAGGTAGSTGAAGGTGGITSFSSLAYFYGASGGGFNSTGATYACGGYPFTSNGSTNVYSSVAYAGTGAISSANPTNITSSSLFGQLSMGGSGAYSSATSFAGLENTTGNGSYIGGAAGGTSGGGGGGAGPQGTGAAGGASGVGGSSAGNNTGAGGGGGGVGSTSGGTGGSGYLYLLMYM